MSLGRIWWRGECTKPKPLTRKSSPDSMKFIYALLSSLIPIKERSFSGMLCQETGCVLKSTGHRFRNWDSSPYSFTWLQGEPEDILMSWDLPHLSCRMRRQSPMTFLLGLRFENWIARDYQTEAYLDIFREFRYLIFPFILSRITNKRSLSVFQISEKQKLFQFSFHGSGNVLSDFKSQIISGNP